MVVTYLGVAYTDFSIAGGIFSLTAGSLPTGAADNIVVTLFPQDFYKLGSVLYRDDRLVEPIQRNELAMLNISPISKPVEQFPVYLFEENKVIIYPQSISNQVQATYIKKPADVMWNFDSSLGYYVWEPSTSVDFELDVTEYIEEAFERSKARVYPIDGCLNFIDGYHGDGDGEECCGDVYRIAPQVDNVTCTV